MIVLTDKDTGGTMLVNPDYVLYVIPKVWGSIVVMGPEMWAEVTETPDEVWQAFDLEAEAEYEELDERPTEDETTVRVSGVPYPVKRTDIQKPAGPNVELYTWVVDSDVED